MSPSINYFESIACLGVRQLKPYEPGKPITELQRELGVDDIIKLASNENPLGPSMSVVSTIEKYLSNIHLYPDDSGFALKNAIAQRLSVQSENIILGNGSCNVIELILRAFVATHNEVVYSQYAFAMYAILTQACGGKGIAVPSVNWGHDLTGMQKAITENTRIIFIANPNNPTGAWVNTEQLVTFLKQVPNHVIVVLDEAYFEYANFIASDLGYPNGIRLLNDFPNLIVTRTFSKAFGLAGLRIGFGLAHKNLVNILNRVRQPFNVTELAMQAAQTVLQDQEYINSTLTVNEEGLIQFEEAFGQLGMEFIPSIGNFISVNLQQDAIPVYQQLLRQGIIVRPVGVYDMPTHLRISIGLANQNEKVIGALSELYKR